jgi:membrane protein YfhO
MSTEVELFKQGINGKCFSHTCPCKIISLREKNWSTILIILLYLNMNPKTNSIEKKLEKWSIPVFSLLLISLVLYIFSDYIFLSKLYLFKDVANDSFNIFYPRWVSVAHYLRNYGIPMWSFKSGMGQNIFPGSICSPFNLILYAFGDSLAYGIIYVEILKIILVWIFTYLYFRTIELSKYVSAIGGLAIAFCGYMMAGSSGWYGHSSLIVYGVFLLFAFEQLYLKKRWYYFPLAIVLISSSSLFYVYIFTVFLFLYVLLRFFTENSWQPKPLITLLLKMAGLGALGLCMNAVFLISSFIKMFHSPRVSGESGHFNELLHTSVFGLATPIEYLSIILRAFATDILGTGEIFIQNINNQQVMLQSYQGWGNYFESPLFYCSIPVLLLIPQIFIFLSKRQKIVYSVFLSFWFFILIFPFFRYALYLFAGNYFKGGLNFFVPVILVLLAMQALNMITNKKKINPLLLILTLIVMLVILNFPYFKEAATPVVKQLQFLSSGLIIVYAFFIFMLTHSKFKVMWKVLFLLVFIFELGYLSSITVNNRVALSVNEFKSKTGYNDYTIDALKFIKARETGFYRIQKEYYSSPAVYESLNDAMVQDFYGTSSYNSFNQKNYIKFLSAADVINPTYESQTRWAPGLVRNPVLQSFASVKYGLSKTENIYFPKFGYKLVHKVGDVYIYENLLFVPLGFSCNQYMFQDEFVKLTKLQKGAALLKAVILTDTDKNLCQHLSLLRTEYIPDEYNIAAYTKDILALREHTLHIEEFTPNHISGKITLPEEKIMVFSIPYDKGWKANVDGKESPIHLVDFGLMGIMLPKGDHTVALDFYPPYLTTGIIISLLALCLYAAALLLCFFPRFRMMRSG